MIGSFDIPGKKLLSLNLDHGWTGGQYSAFRAVLGVYLCVHFANLVPWGVEMFSSAGALADASKSPLAYAFPNIFTWFDAPWFVTAVLVASSTASLLFAAGVRDRILAVVLWYVWACLFGRNPLISNPSLPFIGWILLFHAALPGKPYGAWSMRGRTNPSGDWKLPNSFFSAAWILMAVGYTYSGYTKLISPSWVDGTALREVLESPLARPTWFREFLLGMPDIVLQVGTWSTLALELLALPVALFARLRPPLWLALVGLHLGIIATVDFAELSIGMLIVHLLTFDPSWIAPSRAGVTEHVFYDGGCGLCHRAVRFVLAEDTAEPPAFRFAPLGGETFERALVESDSAVEFGDLPDSIIVATADGEILVKSEAILYIGRRLGGLWRAFSTIASLVPRAVRDFVYDGIARIRHRLFAQPKDVCPLLPPELRERFEG
ncbi:MAG: DCC1-like thiol-disulfide oxidoreductase family protein [Persicimonas sp.]